MDALIRATPTILQGTELQTPSLVSWRLTTTTLLVGGVVVLANPIVFAIAEVSRMHDVLLRRPSVLVATALFTAVWALFVVRRAQRSTSSARMIGWAMLGAALNAGSIAAVLCHAEGSPIVGSIALGFLAVFVATPVSAPVGLVVGVLLWAMHHWERTLRSAPTQDARVRWLSVAALWVGVVGAVGELLGMFSLGHTWRSEAVAVFQWGPHLALMTCAALALVGAWRTARLRQFLDRVEAGGVRGLKLQAPDESAEALTAGRPDAQLVQAEGYGAFRTAHLDLGTISRRAARLRMFGLIALAVFASALLMIVLAQSYEAIPVYRSRSFW